MTMIDYRKYDHGWRSSARSTSFAACWQSSFIIPGVGSSPSLSTISVRKPASRSRIAR